MEAEAREAPGKGARGPYDIDAEPGADNVGNVAHSWHHGGCGSDQKGGSCLHTLLVNAFFCQDVAVSWSLLCLGLGVNTVRDKNNIFGEDDDFGPCNLLELASNGTHGGGTNSWTLTKLALLAGATGNPIAKAGQDSAEGCQYDADLWTAYLEPLLVACESSAVQQRAWWLSEQGARERWWVQGGDFICLLESIRRKPGAHEPHVQLLKRLADLSDIQRIFAQFARCSLKDSITRVRQGLLQWKVGRGCLRGN